MKHNLKNSALNSFAGLIAFIWALHAFSSCKTEQWAGKKIAKIEAKQPKALPEYCATRFPPLVYDSTRTEYIKGETKWRLDSVYVDCDSVVNSNREKHGKVNTDGKSVLNPNRVIVPCPPCAITVDTLRSYQLQVKVNNAKVEALTIERDQLKTEKAVLESQYKGVKKWLYIISAVALIMIVWKIANWMKWLPI